MKNLYLLIAFTLSVAGCSQTDQPVADLEAATSSDSADVIYTNGKIYTVDDSNAWAEAVAIKDGKFVAVGSAAKVEAMAGEGTEVVDLGGRFVMPGLIDTHVHFLAFSKATSQEELDAWIEMNLLELLEDVVAVGVTTVLNTGDYANAILRTKERLINGELKGPRMLVVGPIFTAPNNHPATTVCRDNPFCRESASVEVDDPDLARVKVRELVDAGVDMIKAVYSDNQRGSMGDEVLAAIAAEAKGLGIPIIVHDQSVKGMIRAVELGVDHFVHTPFLGVVDPAEVKRIFVGAGVQITTTAAVYDYAMTDDQGVERSVFGIPMTRFVDPRESTLANAKLLWDAGVNLAFGTDTPPLRTYDAAVLGELRALNEVFSTDQILEMITRRAAVYLGLEGEIGTLEVGKLADIVIIDGDPLDDIGDLANVAMVIQGGRIVVDNR
jgi:imidazolonepropionase-like amidohydrolase